MTSFKPFTIREMEFDVWEQNNALQDKFYQQYQEMGLLQNSPEKQGVIRDPWGTGRDIDLRSRVMTEQPRSQ